MKSLLKIAMIGCVTLISLCAQGQGEVAKNTTWTPASQANRWRIDGNSLGVGQVNNSGAFSRFALFSELSALSNGAVTSINSKTVTSGTSNVALTSDDITPGATNKFYTDVLARAAFSATGPIGYNNTTGAFTFTGTPATVGLGNVTNNAQVINAGGVISFAGGTFSARPAAGTTNRYYIATDQGATYFDNGTAWVLQEPAMTGDATSAVGSTNLTLATVNSNIGTFGSASSVPVIVTDAKGRITGVTTSAITPASIGAAAATAVIPVNFVSTYAGLAGVTAPAAGFLKFVQVGTDGQYSENDDIYLFKPSGKYHKLPLNPSEN